MYVIYKRMRILCVLLFGTSLIWNSVSTKNCDSGKECYFEGGNAPLDWKLARLICERNSSTLPVIRSQQQQKQLEKYLKNNYSRIGGRSQTVWTSGIKKTPERWTWINGQPMTNLDRFKYDNSQYEHTHFFVDTRMPATGLVLKSGNPHTHAWYICQFNGSRCRDNDSLNLTNSCIKIRGDGHETFYDSRNKCLAEGGDLAILAGYDPDLLLQFVFTNKSYFTYDTSKEKDNFWIGLQTQIWQWQSEKNEYVTYSNWRQNSPSPNGDCISIDTNTGLWSASDCNENKTVVCQREMDSQPLPPPPPPPTTSKQTFTDPPIPKEVIYIAVIAICIVIIIIIVIGICLIRRKRKSAEEMNHVHYIRRQETGTPRSPESNGHPSHTQSGNEGQVRDTTRPNEIPPSAPQIYAEIAPTSNPNDAANKGVLYASLDFAKNEEVTYAEPMKKKPSTETAETEKTKAEAQHKIGPKGDVYALPITNPSSPGTKSTEPRVYANLGV